MLQNQMTQNRSAVELAPEKLNTQSYYWEIFHLHIISRSQSRFGAVGQAIVRKEQSKAPVMPTEGGIHDNGSLKYPSGPDGELTFRVDKLFDSDTKRYDADLKQYIIDDKGALAFIRDSTSSSSLILAESSTKLAAFQELPLGFRATGFLSLLESIHSAADD
jgi:hypothetical protein